MESAEYEIKLRDAFSAGLGKIEGRMNQFESKVGGLGSSMASVFGGVSLAGAVSTGLSFLGDMAKSVVSLGADMEMTRVSFATMLGGDDARADKLITDIQDLGAKTVFTSGQINKQAQMLLNYGTAADDVIPTLTMLGDASAGNLDSFQSLTRAFGQIQATGRLMGQDLNQLINAGFNPLQEISKKTGKSMSVLKKEMEDGKIPFSAVKDAFKAATSEGGRFYGLNEKLSKTLSGRWSTLQDTIERMGTSLGMKLLPFLGKVVDGLSKFAELIPKLNFSAYTYSLKEIVDLGKDVFTVFSDLFSMFGGGGMDALTGLQLGIQYLSLTLRIALTPLRVIINTFMIAINAIKTASGVLYEFFQMGKNLVTGNITDAFTNMGNIQKLGSDFGKSVKGAFDKEKQGWINIFNPQKQKEEEKKAGAGAGAGGGAGSTALGTSGSGNKAIGVEKIQAGTRNVVVNISKLIEKVTFEKGYKESEAKLQEMISRALLSAVNDVNIVSQ